ncbi:MAG TPA: SRPBCC family protein [Actinomycetes bacterium]|nr:SRPBCC family protein [Actinomycetes bacterium]
MELEHRFSVPVPVAQAWDVLLDVERIAPCMPGATVESFDGETIEGRVKVKVGPIQVTYAGTAKFVEKDEAGRRAVIDASAKEARGSGTAAATITAVLTDAGGSTDVVVTTDLQITGKPAQFGRGVMVEVGNKILGKFAECLADELSGKPAAAAAGAETAAAAAGIAESTTAAGAQATTAPPPLRRVAEEEAIDLLGTAGLPVLKRVLPVVGAVVIALILWRLVSRRR